MLKQIIETLFAGGLIVTKKENKHVSNGWTKVGNIYSQKATLT